MQKEQQFLKVKVDKNYLPEIIYTREGEDNSKAKVTEACKNKVHPDFITAINKLALHYGILTGYIDPKDVKQAASYSNKILDSFVLRGFTMGEDEDDRWIMMHGHRIVPWSKKAVIVNSPAEHIDREGETQYKFTDELLAVVEEIKDEAEKYLAGKFAAEPQGSLPFDGKDKEEETK